MPKYIEWQEPWEGGEGPTDWVNVILRVKWEDAARLQKFVVMKDQVRQPRDVPFVYKTDDEAAEDFLAVHWGRIRVLPE